jgi:UDP-glucose:(heptosyl)LPS alpha-1,3-glucosyltransferase
MKIAIIKRESHPIGGLEKMSSLIVNALTQKGAQISLFTTDLYKPKGILKAQKLKNFDNWLSKNTASFDVIFSMDRASHQTHHRAGNGVHAAYLDLRAQAEGTLKKWSFAINPLHRLQLELEKKTFESPQTKIIIVNSAMVQSQILQHYNTPPSKIHVIHNSIDYLAQESDFISSFTHHNRPSTFQFIFIGNNFQRKGLHLLIQALSLLNHKNFHLSVIGTDKNLSFYKTLTTRLGLQKQITFLGAQKDTKPFYLAADCLVIPSLYDPFANVTIEAISLGLFVISSRANGGHEILNPNSGIIIENPHEIEELATALKIALNHPKDITSATRIRESVSHLDHTYQLEKVCKLCLT